MIDVWI